MSSINLVNVSDYENLRRYEDQKFRTKVEFGDLKHHVFLYKIYDNDTNTYKAFCSGNIISSKKVLTSAHCFLSNRKRYVSKPKNVQVVGGSLSVLVQKEPDVNQQWRNIKKVHSQKYYRFPAYSLAVVIVETPWDFENTYLNFIPIASLNSDFDGICYATAVRTITSWAMTKVLATEQMHMIKRHDCEIILQRNCKIFYCTAYAKENALAATETEGGGLVCYKTGDPEELDERGLLVGVTTLVNIHLPSLHNRIAIFRKWITDSANAIYLQNKFIYYYSVIVLIRYILPSFAF